jgi:VWFA-related protein
MLRQVGVLTVAFAAGIVLAQQSGPQGQFTSGVEVRVVNVEVMVTDRDGLPVTDLLPSDFEILEDGHPQPVTNFFRIVNGAAQLNASQRAAGTTREDERFQRRVVLVVDDNSIGKVARHQALDRLRDFVANRFDGEAQWAVAAIGEKLDFLQPFSRDRYEVSAALDEIGKLPTYAKYHSLDRSLPEDPVRAQFMQFEQQPQSSLDIGEDYRFSSREQAMRNLHSFAVMADVLNRLMLSYSSFGGRKAIVLVTGTLEFHPEMQYLVSKDPHTWNDSGLTDRTPSDPSIEGAKKQLEGVLAGIVRSANSAGFQLYVINGEGLKNPVRVLDVERREVSMVKNAGAFAAPPELSDPSTAPMTLARGTGGFALTSNDLGKDLGKVVDDTATYYSLGYEPDHAPDRRYHSIIVKVKRPGLKVRYRSGYLDLSDSERVAEELATPLSFPKPKGSLPVSLKVEELGPDGGKIKLVAHVDVPIKALTLLPKADGTLHAEPEVILAIYNERGENITVLPRRFPIDVPAGQEDAARAGAVKPNLVFSLQPGAYTIAVTVQDPVLHERGTALQRVLVGHRKG